LNDKSYKKTSEIAETSALIRDKLCALSVLCGENFLDGFFVSQSGLDLKTAVSVIDVTQQASLRQAQDRPEWTRRAASKGAIHPKIYPLRQAQDTASIGYRNSEPALSAVEVMNFLAHFAFRA